MAILNLNVSQWVRFLSQVFNGKRIQTGLLKDGNRDKREKEAFRLAEKRNIPPRQTRALGFKRLLSAIVRIKHLFGKADLEDLALPNSVLEWRNNALRLRLRLRKGQSQPPPHAKQKTE